MARNTSLLHEKRRWEYLMTNLIKKEKKNRRNSAGFSLEELYRKALLGRLHYYQKIQDRIPETKYRLEDPLGFQADKEIGKIDQYFSEVSRRETLTKKQILRLFSFRKVLSGIIKKNLGRRIDQANLLLKQIDGTIGKRNENID